MNLGAVLKYKWPNFKCGFLKKRIHIKLNTLKFVFFVVEINFRTMLLFLVRS